MATGLEKQIEARRMGVLLDKKEPISYSNIALIIHKPYNTTKRKIQNGTLTVAEAIKIYKDLGFKAKSTFDAFEYLFTEQED